MLFSVVVPSLDQGAYISDCLDSVLSQEGDFDLEVIVVDGGSSDDSVEKILSYGRMAKSPDFSPCCNSVSFMSVVGSDLGQANAINKGFRLASGDVLNWLCSDDVLTPGSLASVERAFRQEPCSDIVFGDGYELDENGDVLGVFKSRSFSRDELVRRWDTAYHLFYLPQPSLFFKRVLLNRYGYLDEDLEYSMDYDLYLRFCGGENFRYLNRVLSGSRFTPESKSVRYRRQQFEESMDVSRRYWGKKYLIYWISYMFYRSVKKPVWSMLKQGSLSGV